MINIWQYNINRWAFVNILLFFHIGIYELKTKKSPESTLCMIQATGYCFRQKAV